MHGCAWPLPRTAYWPTLARYVLKAGAAVAYCGADGRREVTGEDRWVRPAQSVIVFDATYLGRVFKASAMAPLPGSIAPL